MEFAGAALAVAFVFGPLAGRLATNRDQAERAVQRAIQRAYAFSVRCWQVLRVIRVTSQGLDEIAPGPACVIVANHPSLMDVVVVGSHFAQMDCIVNAGWTARSPFLARGIAAAGYIHNNRGAAVVEECSARLQNGRSLLIFPEGTRSPEGGLGKLHRGAAHAALASGAPLVVVSIRCTPPLLVGRRKWHDVGSVRSEYQLRVAGRLDPRDYQSENTTAPMAARRMTEDLRGIFLKELNLADA